MGSNAPAETPKQKPLNELLFTSLKEEKTIDSLPVTGKVPTWLKGSFVRNGPALFEINTDCFKHWFDGQAMLHSFSFDGSGGKIGYNNKFVQSHNFKAHKAAGKIAAYEFVSRPKKNFFQNIGALFGGEDDVYENVNVNVEKMNGHAVAYTETQTGQLEFDPKTVETIGPVVYEDDKEEFASQMNSAHPLIAPNGDFINFALAFGKDNYYKIYRVKNTGGPNKREMIAKVLANPIAYHHAFSVSEDYIVLVEAPYYFSLGKMMMNNVKNLFFTTTSSIGDIFEWDKSAPTKFLVVRQSNGEIVGRFHTDQFMSYHHANCVQDGDLLHIDLMCYDRNEFYDSMLLENMRAEDNLDFGAGALRRYTINLKEAKPGTSEGLTMSVLYDGHMEFCRINEKYRGNKDYRFIYSVCEPRDKAAWSTISKLDVQTKEVKFFEKPNCAIGEPVFVPNPNATSEDDGVVVAVLLNGDTQKSELVGLDGKTFQQVFLAEIPHHIPMGLHGNHFD